MVSLKSIFGAKSLKDVTLEDINDQMGNIRLQRKMKNISQAEYKKYKKFLSDLENKKIEAVSAHEDKVKRMLKLKEKRKDTALKKQKTELRNIVVNNDTYTEGKKYIVSANLRIRYIRQNKSKALIVREADIMMSEEITAENNDTTYDMIRRAWNQYTRNNYSADSDPEILYRSNVQIVPKKAVNLAKVKMKGLKMLYNSFKDIPHMFEGQCVIDYLLWEASKVDSRKSWTRTMLTEKLGDEPDTGRIMLFCKTEKDVSMYALDMTMKAFQIINAEKPRVALYFIVNNNHLYPIIDDNLRRKIRANHEISFEDIRLSKKDYENVSVLEESLIDTAEGDHVIVKGVDDLTLVAGKIMAETKHIIERFSFFDNKLTAFKHPIKDQIYVAGRDWDERKAICDKHYNKYKVADYKFINQSWGNIARTMYENLYGSIPSSGYSEDLKTIFQNYSIAPYRMCVDKHVSSYKSIDIRRCYTSVFMNNPEPWAVFSAFDSIEPVTIKSVNDIKVGEYYIEPTWTNPFTKEVCKMETFNIGKGNITLSRGFYPSVFVKYVLENKYIKPEDITYGIEARGSLPADAFKHFAERVVEEYPDESKYLLNMLTGCFGSLYSRTEAAGVTNDLLTALGTMAQHKDQKPVLNCVGDLYILRMVKEQMKDYGDMPIYRSVIAQGIMALDKLTNVIVDSGTEVIGYNTDAIKIRGTYNKSVVEADPAIGGYHKEPVWFNGALKPLTGLSMSELPIHDEYVYKPIVLNESTDTPVDGSALVIGPGGCGKSYTIKQLYKPEDTVLCASNMACENLKKDKVMAKTFDSFLYDPATCKLNKKKFAEVTRLIVDEYTMVNTSIMAMIVSAQKQYKFPVLFFGDPSQCKAVCDDWVAYHKNKIFLEMVNGRIIHLTYKFKRYDLPLYEKLAVFRKTGRIDMPAGNIVNSYHNICKTNKQRHKINKECFQRWLLETKAKSVKVKDFDVAAGLEVMAYDENDLDLGIYKTNRYIITNITDDTVSIEGLGQKFTLSYEKFAKIFDYSFCVTMYKIQGAEYRDHYNIFEAHMMSRNELYTAISRGISMDMIHIDRLRDGVYYSDYEKTLEHKVVLPKFQTGRIYRIPFSDGTDYIGKTVDTLEVRLAQHKLKPTSAKMREAFANNTCTIELLDEFIFTNNRTLLNMEKMWIQYKASESRLNKVHNIPELAKQVKQPKFKTRTKYNITHDASKSRFCIRYTVDGKELTERFSYVSCSQEEAMAKAEARQLILRAQ